MMTRSFLSAALKRSVHVRAGVEKGGIFSLRVCSISLFHHPSSDNSPALVKHMQNKERKWSESPVGSSAHVAKKSSCVKKKTKNNAHTDTYTRTPERMKRSVHARHRGGPSGGLTSFRSVCESENWSIPAATDTSHRVNI